MGDAREIGLRVLAKSPAIISARVTPSCVRPPEMNMQEPSGEYLRRAPIRVRRVSKDEADQNRHGSLPLFVRSRSCKPNRFLLVGVSYARKRKFKKFKNFNKLILEYVNKK